MTTKRRRRIRSLWRHASRPLSALWRWGRRPPGARKELTRLRALRKWAAVKVRYYRRAGRAKLADSWLSRKAVYWRWGRKATRRAQANKRGRQRLRRTTTASRIVVQAGAPHWGGCDDILRNEVEPVVARWGYRPNSGKRWATYGNPGSDHYAGNRTASARDFPTANNYRLAQAIRSALAGGTHRDYESFYFRRAGRIFRGQIIAGAHGTGPHLHCGLRLS